MKHFEWATEVFEVSFRATEKLLYHIEDRQSRTQMDNASESISRRGVKLASEPRGVTRRDLLGGISASQRRLLDDSIRHLLESELITEISFIGKTGHAAKLYVLRGREDLAAHAHDLVRTDQVGQSGQPIYVKRN